MPEPLSEDELERIVDDAIAENGRDDMRDMGRVMADVMPQIAGRADGWPSVRSCAKAGVSRQSSSGSARAASVRAPRGEPAQPGCGPDARKSRWRTSATRAPPRRAATPAPTSRISCRATTNGARRRRSLPRCGANAAMGVRTRDLLLEDRAERGDAGCDPDLAERVVDPGGHPALRGSTTPIAAGARVGLTMPMPMPATMKPGSSVVQRGAVRDAAHQHQAEAHDRQPAAEQDAHGQGGQPARERRGEERDERERQEAQPRPEAARGRACSGCTASGRGTSRTSKRTGRTPRSTRPRTPAGGTGSGRASASCCAARSATNATDAATAPANRADDERAAPTLGVAADQREHERERAPRGERHERRASRRPRRSGPSIPRPS